MARVAYSLVIATACSCCCLPCILRSPHEHNLACCNDPDALFASYTETLHAIHTTVTHSQPEHCDHSGQPLHVGRTHSTHPRRLSYCAVRMWSCLLCDYESLQRLTTYTVTSATARTVILQPADAAPELIVTLGCCPLIPSPFPLQTPPHPLAHTPSHLADTSSLPPTPTASIPSSPQCRPS
jgi:hypothetical protein